ncbi:MAG TPA: glutamate--tRNA ligase [Mariprofundaceae bacterium]|nr:glutamate--tRNA ligase [Mariprofundaceae bacterium]
MTIRTRFAPSPTGMLHIGGARTALFSWLYARHLGGEFLLRIEDTDRERSTDEATQVILDGLRWLGLDWDGEPVFQAGRQAEHVVAVEQLLAEGHAYRCYCTREELDTMRERQMANGEKPKYDGRCRHRSDRPEGVPFVVRFRSPDEGETVVRDLVLGDVTFSNGELDDLILLRSDGTPTYNLAVVADDAAMGITHVIRGADHLNNTPRQIQLYEALGLTPPAFGHIPLIHGPDGAKMSKRHGAVAITEYREAGYLADAVVNYLARLGWSHGDEEVFGREQLVALFDVKDVGRTAARFDQNKLDWLNAHYLRNSIPLALVSDVTAKLAAMGIGVEHGPELAEVIAILQERSRNLQELADGAHMFYRAPHSYDEKAVQKHIKDVSWNLLDKFVAAARQLSAWDAASLHVLLQQVCEEAGEGLGKLAQPIRIMLSGTAVSPPIDATLALLGRDEALARIERGSAALRQG